MMRKQEPRPVQRQDEKKQPPRRREVEPGKAVTK